jgi:hypothetical protein
MSRYNGEWTPYVPVAERRRKAEREMEKLRKKGHSIAPVTIEGRAIATTFWGKAWCTNLESYGDYQSRLPRGRTYVRNGSVVDLQIGPLGIKARVSGSSIYTVTISVGAVSKPVAVDLQRFAPAGSIPWWSFCRGAFRRASWSASAVRPMACFRSLRKFAFPAAALTTHRCANMLRRHCTASARGWTKGQNFCSACGP